MLSCMCEGAKEAAREEVALWYVRSETQTVQMHHRSNTSETF